MPHFIPKRIGRGPKRLEPLNGTPGRRRQQELNNGMPKGWRNRRPEGVPYTPIEKKDIQLYGIVSTWYDADIIGAVVANCFDQGCSRVYLLDNFSPDNSVEVAKAAGAEVWKIYETTYYDDDYRVR